MVVLLDNLDSTSETSVIDKFDNFPSRLVSDYFFLFSCCSYIIIVLCLKNGKFHSIYGHVFVSCPVSFYLAYEVLLNIILCISMHFGFV